MAKKFNEVYKTAKQTVYGSLDNVFITAASKNAGVDFTPVLQPNGSTSTAKYILQVAKRNKSKTIGTAGDIVTSTNDTGAMTTADNLKILDSFGKFDWESEDIVTGQLRGIGHKLGFNDEYDADNLSQTQANYISSETGNLALTRKEILIEKTIAGGTWAGEIDLSAADTAIWDTVTKGVRKIMKVSDDFKHRSAKSNIVVFMDSDVKDAAAKEIGTKFNQEAPIYTTGLNSQFSINGTPVVELAELDQFISADALNTDKVTTGILILDLESVAFKAANEEKGIDVPLGTTRFVGNLFYDITHVLTIGKTKERIQVYGLKGSTTASAGVND